MTRTALHEFFGSSRATVSSANVRLGLPSRANGARFHSVYISTAGKTVRLPDARQLIPGGEPQFSVYNDGPNSFDVVAGDGSTVVRSAAPNGSVTDCYLLDNSTAAGTWFYSGGTGAKGTAITLGRQRFSITLSGQVFGFDLGAWCTSLGWDESSPVSASVTITAGSVVGGNGNGLAAFRAVDLPSGSRLLLRNHGYILGHGGKGGGLGQTASDGQDALEVEIPTVLINQPTGAVSEHGTIAGGGGGGLAAGPNVWLVGGGGGGGGAGARAGVGGLPATSAYPGQAGLNGGFSAGGPGGIGGVHPNGSTGTQGGYGGDWGEAGEVPVGILAAATSPGRAIVGVANVTKLVAGTIIGVEV